MTPTLAPHGFNTDSTDVLKSVRERLALPFRG
jgi:hypothetical protein